MGFVASLVNQSKDSLRDLAPVVLVMAFFQLVVIRQPLPDSLALIDLVLGLVFVVAGLTLFIKGLELGLFPLGENLARAFVKKARSHGCWYLRLRWGLALPWQSLHSLRWLAGQRKWLPKAA